MGRTDFNSLHLNCTAALEMMNCCNFFHTLLQSLTQWPLLVSNIPRIDSMLSERNGSKHFFSFLFTYWSLISSLREICTVISKILVLFASCHNGKHICSFNEVPNWFVFDRSHKSDRVVQKSCRRA